MRATSGSDALDLLCVMVTHNSAVELPACVNAIRAHADGCRVGIRVVDAGSSDETARISRELDVDVELCPNVGFGAGTNIGWRTGPRARYLLILNPDATIVEGSLRALVEFGDAHPEAGVIAPRLVDRRGAASPSVTPFEGAWRRLWDQLRRRHVDARQQVVDDVRPFGWATGCALLVRGSCFDSVGRFDERFFLYAEERDLQRATSAAGWQHLAYPGLVVAHDTSGREPDARLFAQRFRADLHYARKWDGLGGVAATRGALGLLLLRRLVGGHAGKWTGAYLAALQVVLTERVPVDAHRAREIQRRRTLVS